MKPDSAPPRWPTPWKRIILLPVGVLLLLAMDEEWVDRIHRDGADALPALRAEIRRRLQPYQPDGE